MLPHPYSATPQPKFWFQEKTYDFRNAEVYSEWCVAPVVPADTWSSRRGCGSIPAMAYGQKRRPQHGQQAGRRGGGAGSDMGERTPLAPDVVIISSNENPLGPAQSAL